MSLYKASAVWALFPVLLAAQSTTQCNGYLCRGDLQRESHDHQEGHRGYQQRFFKLNRELHVSTGTYRQHQARLVNGVFEKNPALWRGWVAL